MTKRLQAGGRGSIIQENELQGLRLEGLGVPPGTLETYLSTTGRPNIIDARHRSFSTLLKDLRESGGARNR